MLYRLETNKVFLDGLYHGRLFTLINGSSVVYEFRYRIGDKIEVYSSEFGIQHMIKTMQVNCIIGFVPYSFFRGLRRKYWAWVAKRSFRKSIKKRGVPC